MSRLIRHDAKGPAVIQTADGIIEICQCGLSNDKPFCDGSHRQTRDEVDGVLYAYDAKHQRVEISDLFPPTTKKFTPPK